jgi:hypothetical protein
VIGSSRPGPACSTARISKEKEDKSADDQSAVFSVDFQVKVEGVSALERADVLGFAFFAIALGP